MAETVNEDIFPEIKELWFLKCDPDWELPRKKPDSCNFTYLIQGAAQYTVNGKTIDLEQGSLLALPRGAVRRGITFPGKLMHCFSVDFMLYTTSKFAGFRNSPTPTYQDAPLPFPMVSQPGRHEDIVHLFHELVFYWEAKPAGYIIKTRGLFLQLYHRFLELVVYQNDPGITDSRIVKVVRYVTAHFAERITVKMMASMVGLNSTYFGILFKNETGTSFNRYLIQTRIRNAETMLSGGEVKLSNIAEACGFTDTAHFYKQFKMIKGFAPTNTLLKKV
jgi:AraC-like DNA-binding protein